MEQGRDIESEMKEVAEEGEEIEVEEGEREEGDKGVERTEEAEMKAVFQQAIETQTASKTLSLSNSFISHVSNSYRPEESFIFSE